MRIQKSSVQPRQTPAPAQHTNAVAARRAPSSASKGAQVWKTLVAKFMLPGQHGLLREDAGSNAVATVWPHGQVLAAALDRARTTGNYKPFDQLLAAMKPYALGSAYAPGIHPKPGTARFYDDNAWIGLDLMQAYGQTHDKKYLHQAEKLYAFVKRGQVPGGGVRWVERGDTVNTCSTAPAGELAARLYLATHDKADLKFAEDASHFLDAHLRRPDGLYADHLKNGRIADAGVYTYNQGTPLGLKTLLYRATHQRSYLEGAQQTAAAALAHFKNGGFYDKSPAFNAIFFRNLLSLDAVAPNPAYRRALHSYLDQAWKARDANGFFSHGMGSYTKGKATVLDMAGLAQLFTIADWPASKLLGVS